MIWLVLLLNVYCNSKTRFVIMGFFVPQDSLTSSGFLSNADPLSTFALIEDYDSLLNDGLLSLTSPLVFYVLIYKFRLAYIL